MMNPDNLRQELRQIRRNLPAPEREQALIAIAARVSEMPEFNSARHIAGYLAFDGEFDPGIVLETARSQGKQIYLPILRGKNQALRFAPWGEQDELVLNRYKILEPQVAESEWVDGTALDLVLTPLVGFDENANRMGMGGGFYDRTFEFLLKKKSSTKLVGVAFECQKAKQIPQREWDVPLAAVVTEQAIYHHYKSAS